MSNEEIKALMLELAEHLNKATEIIEQLRANNKKTGRGTEVLAARISYPCNEPFKADVQCCDLPKDFMQAPVEIRERSCDVYPFEYVYNVNGVEFFELCDRKEEQLNEAV